MVPSFGEDIGNSHLCVMYWVIKIGKNLYVCLVYKNKTRTSNKCKKFFCFLCWFAFFVFYGLFLCFFKKTFAGLCGIWYNT